MYFVILSVLSSVIAIPHLFQDRNDYFSDLELSKFDDSLESNQLFDDSFASKIEEDKTDAVRENRDKWGGAVKYDMGAEDDMSMGQKMEDDISNMWPWPRRQPDDSEFRNDCAVVVSMWKALGKRTILRPGLVLRNGCCRGAPFFYMNDIPGVTCADGHVTDIDWYHKGLTGPIPESIKYLKNLKNIWLSHNSISGPIPEELLQLTNLEGLWLNNNQLSGNIPVGISSLSNLLYLFLNNNLLTGEIPKEMGQLSELEGLYLNNNELTGNIPEELGELKRLRYLYLNNNNFSGSIPSGITSLEDLKYL